jgi:class 3 adenylate cyclase
MEGGVRVHLAGRLAIEVGTNLLDAARFRGRQGRTALAYLAARRDRPVPRDELADVLWPQQLPGSWEADLSAVVSRLRRVLADAGLPDAIPLAVGCYRLALPEGSWVDVEEAARSLAAAEDALRAGDCNAAAAAASVARDIAARNVLPGDEGPWLDRMRAELREVRLRALDVLVEAWTAAGDVRAGIRCAQDIIETEPLRETAYRQLIRLHAAAGNRAEALRTYERCRQLLADQLGADPDPQTEAAYLDVLRATATARSPERGTVTMLFTDLVGSTQLLSKLGDEAYEGVRRTHFGLLRDAVSTRGGEEVKSIGDGLMVVFASTLDALGCAVGMQQAVDRHNQRAPVALQVRVGLHAGEPIRDEGDYFGSTVVVARRLCDRAAGGQILASDLVRGLAGPRGGFVFRDVGPLELKGLDAPVSASEVGWEPPREERIPLPPLLAVAPASPFVGRTAEFAKLGAAIDAARRDGTRVVMVCGEPGIGKTRLVSELARAAHGEGVLVLYGRCDEEMSAGYHPFAEALGHYVRAVSAEQLRRTLGGGASDLVRVLPEIAHKLPSLPEPATSDPDVERLRLFDALSAALAATAPVVLVLDDLHWADAATLLLLRHIARRPSAEAVLVVGTYRDTEVDADHPVERLLSAVRRDGRGEGIALGGLTQADAEALLGDADLARTLVGVTRGNPLFLRETARHLAESGPDAGLPDTVKDVIGRRFTRLGDDARRVLDVGAVAGAEFDLAAVAAVLDASEEQVLQALEACVGARLIDEVAGVLDRYAFVHALVRETLYESLTASRRVRIHRRVADAIEGRSPAEDGPHLAELAHHYAEGGVNDRAFEYARRAGAYAMTNLAYEEAVVNLERALELTDERPFELLMDLGRARRCAGDSSGARVAYEEAAGIAEARGTPDELGRAALGVAEAWTLTGAVDEGKVDWLERALAVLPADDALRARVLAKLAVELYWAPEQAARRDALSAEALDIARRAGDPYTLAHCLDVRNFVMIQRAGLDDQRAAADEILQLGERTGDREIAITGLNWRLLSHGSTGDLDAFARDLERYGRIADELRQPRYVWYWLTRRASLACAYGRYDESERLASQAHAIGLAAGEADADNVFYGEMTHVWLDRGDRDGLPHAIELTRRHEGLHPGNVVAVWWAARAAQLAAEVGERELAGTMLDALQDRIRQMPVGFNWIDALVNAAAITALLGNAEVAAELVPLLEPLSGRFVYTGVAMMGCADHWLGALLGLLGEPDRAVAYLKSAVAVYDRIGLQPWSARARYELARLGEVDPEEPLRIARELGMRPLAQRLEALRERTTST